MRSRNVVLPEPEGPSKAVISPGLNTPETSRRSVAVALLSRKDGTVYVRFRTVTRMPRAFSRVRSANEPGTPGPSPIEGRVEEPPGTDEATSEARIAFQVDAGARAQGERAPDGVAPSEASEASEAIARNTFFLPWLDEHFFLSKTSRH